MSSPKSPPPEIVGFTYTTGIGGGGFADVFLYTQHSTGRGVAVKVLRSEHLSDQSLTQFETEARIMAGVSTHPFIVTIHDAGIAADGRPYLVMEHYPQPHFGRRASGGRLPISEVLRVGVQVSSAVETAHRVGILHRDIKPANVLTSAYGDPGLTDFGIAGVQTDQGMSAASGVSYGFSAPEVILDDTATGTVASDVYGLGATIYALVAGRSPVYVPGGDNSSAALARRVTSGGLQPLRRDDVPRSLELLLLSTLDADPRSRPSTAADLAESLRYVEQELRLPPTPLVVTGTMLPSTSATPMTPPTAGDPTDDPGAGPTRRAPRVVHAHGDASTAARAPYPPSVPPTPTAGSSAPPSATSPSLPVTSGSAGTSIGEDRTVARPARTSTGLNPSPLIEPAPGRVESAVGSGSGSDDRKSTDSVPPSRRWLPAAMAVGVLLLIIGVVLAGQNQGGEKADVTTTVAIGPVNGEMGGDLGAFDLERFEVRPDGTIELAWTQPANADAPNQVTYEVVRTDLPNETVLTTLTGKLEATIPARTIAANPPTDSQVCILITGTLGSRYADSGRPIPHCKQWKPGPAASTSPPTQP